jgi:hypothetical protein
MRTRTHTAAALTAAALLALGACSTGDNSGSNNDSKTTATAPSTAAASTTSAAPLNAEQVVKALTEAITDTKAATVYTAETDPNKLLGRPGGYTSKADFTDQRAKPNLDDEVQRGGSVEVYDDPATAKKRSEYITKILEGVPAFGTEYHYVKDGILLRVSGALTPDQAGEYEAALKQLS